MFSDIGIDMGSATTKIFAGRGIVLREPSVVTVETATGNPISFGEEAFRMIGRTPENMTPICPVERGVIADYDVAESMLQHFTESIISNKMIKSRIMLAMPAGITTVQQRSLRNAAESCGARSVCLIEGPVAAAIGVGVDFSQPHGSIVVDIGAGTTDVAVLSMGGLSQCESARSGGLDLDEAIIRFVRKANNILIGSRTAEEIKKTIGCALHRPVEIAMKAKGRNLFTGLPEVFEITSNEVCDAIADVTYGIGKTIQTVLEKTPPELVGDIASDGIILCGGAAQLHGMAEFIARYTGITAELVEDPTGCVARGTGRALENFDMLKGGGYEFRTLQDLIIE